MYVVARKTKGQDTSWPSISAVVPCGLSASCWHRHSTNEGWVHWYNFVLWQFVEDKLRQTVFCVFEDTKCWIFKETTAVVYVLLICMSEFPLHDDPEPPCLILGS